MRSGLPAALSAALALFAVNAVADPPAVGPDSHLPVPRFASLKTVGANGRHGPGLEHRVDWIYERAGLPLEIIAESGPWRRVRDPDGDQVWIHAQNLENRRTVYVRETTPLRRNAHETSRAVAVLGPGVVAPLTGCTGDWRRITLGGRVGWVLKSEIWGGDDCTGV